MVKKTLTYTDYNDVERTEDFYFNISKAELMEMETQESGGFSEYLKRIIAAQDIPQLMRVFKRVIMKAYGQKSPDGKRFMKTPEILEEFIQTEAYSNLYMELCTNAEVAADFVNGVMPSDLQSMVPADQSDSPPSLLPMS